MTFVCNVHRCDLTGTPELTENIGAGPVWQETPPNIYVGVQPRVLNLSGMHCPHQTDEDDCHLGWSAHCYDSDGNWLTAAE